jgi:DNA-binding beta-propeller fold protein YncE
VLRDGSIRSPNCTGANRPCSEAAGRSHLSGARWETLVVRRVGAGLGALLAFGGLLVVGVRAGGAAAASRRVLPGCSTAVAPGPMLSDTARFASVQGSPFGVVTGAGGRFTFVSSDGSGAGGVVEVFTGDGMGVAPVATIPVVGGAPAGMALAEGGRVLLVADGANLSLIDVAAAERGSAGAVVASQQTPGSEAIEVGVTPDGRFALVSMETSAQVDVFRLHGEASPSFVGAVRVGMAPVGMAFSPDGRTAYVTSEVAGAVRPSRTGAGGSLRLTTQGQTGTLSVLDVSKMEQDPRRAVIRTVDAGCSPVRVAVSPDGRTVWVTARGSDAVLGFSARALASDSGALVAVVDVGAAPVGLALVDGGARLIVADSNRFGTGSSASLAVLDTSAALAGGPALLGYLPAGGFPREMTVGGGGSTLLVTNYDSGQLEAVPVAPLASGH